MKRLGKKQRSSHVSRALDATDAGLLQPIITEFGNQLRYPILLIISKDAVVTLADSLEGNDSRLTQQTLHN